MSKWLHDRKKFEPEMLSETEPTELIKQTSNALLTPLKKLSVERDIPTDLTQHLKKDVFIFSGFKVAHEIEEASRLLQGDDGDFKSFENFSKDIAQLNDKYNRNYLNAEYNFATASVRMAVKWKDYEQDGDRYDLQYRTASDGLVREEHAALHNITLPIDDPFWNSYFPPNGWNCRCTAVQVRKGKYPESDSNAACAAGEKATTQIGKDGSNKAAIFRFNPGKVEKVFPPKHPNYKTSTKVKKEVEKVVDNMLQQAVLGTKKIKKVKDLNVAFNTVADKTGWFKQGFKKIKKTKRNVNGSTDMEGTIYLAKKHLDNSISSAEKMRTGQALTEDEERSIGTLWHEITHNRHTDQGGTDSPGSASSKTRDYMELANEFVARKTLPEFYSALGGKMNYPEFMSDRTNCGYNDSVLKYEKAISDNGLDEKKVLESVKKHLFEGRYDDQKQGLINALVENSNDKISESDAKIIVEGCL